MEIQMMLSNILTGINLLLALVLFGLYLRMHLKARSSFTIGLLLFAGLFIVQNAVAFYFYITMMPYFVPEVASYALSLTFLQAMALAILNWITWK